MMLDKLDIEIIRNFYELKSKEEMDFPDMVKKILQCKKAGNSEYNLINNRIKKLTRKNIFQIVQNSPTKFILNLDSVFQKKISFPTRRRKGLAVEIDGKFQIFEL